MMRLCEAYRFFGSRNRCQSGCAVLVVRFRDGGLGYFCGPHLDVLKKVYPELEAHPIPIDNPRCWCPDCGADLGWFYSNRLMMTDGPKPGVLQ